MEAAGVAASAGIMMVEEYHEVGPEAGAQAWAEVETEAGAEAAAHASGGHDIPQEVLENVVYWLQKGGSNSCLVDELDFFRKRVQEGAKHCYNEGCEVVGHPKDFKVCPQCRAARYCGAACQKQHWNAGGHKTTCGTFHA